MWSGEPWHSMADLRRRSMALHVANASDSFVQPPAYLVAHAHAIHAAQRHQMGTRPKFFIAPRTTVSQSRSCRSNPEWEASCPASRQTSSVLRLSLQLDMLFSLQFGTILKLMNQAHDLRNDCVESETSLTGAVVGAPL